MFEFILGNIKNEIFILEKEILKIWQNKNINFKRNMKF